jgi:hypothetical protein
LLGYAYNFEVTNVWEVSLMKKGGRNI